MRLSHRDYERLAEVLSELHGFADLDQFREGVLHLLNQLVSADVLGYTEFHSRDNRVFAIHWPDSAEIKALMPAFAAHSDQHPSLNYLKQARATEWVQISDFLTRPQWERTDLYNTFFGPLRQPYQLGILLESSPGLQLGFGLNRGGRDYNGSERAILELFKPHLLQAYRNCKELTELKGKSTAMARTLESSKRGLLALGPSGRIQWMVGPVRDWTWRYLHTQVERGDLLPEVLRRWAQSQRDSARKGLVVEPKDQVFRIRQEHRTLAVRLTEEALGGVRLLFEEQTVGLVVRPNLSELTARENEVLRWMAQGKTNVEIAVILSLSRRTVDKHVEHILSKLGVENRACAVLQALDAR